MSTNTKYPTMKRVRSTAWNHQVFWEAQQFPNYNNSTNPLPPMFAGKSPNMVNTLMVLGWDADATLALLNHADQTGDHPEWSEADWDELLYHFQQLEHLMETGRYYGTVR